MIEGRKIEGKYLTKYVELPAFYKVEFVKKFKKQFDYRSRRRFDQLIKGKVTPTPDEYKYIIETLFEYHSFLATEPEA